MLPTPETRRGAALLLLRGAAGASFVAHGVQKLRHPDANERFFADQHLPAPTLLAPAIAVLEAGGGALLVAGLGTPVAGLLLAGDMAGALVTVHLGHGFFVEDGGVELVLLLGGASLALALAGAGRFSADAWWRRARAPRARRRAAGRRRAR